MIFRQWSARKFTMIAFSLVAFTIVSAVIIGLLVRQEGQTRRDADCQLLVRLEAMLNTVPPQNLRLEVTEFAEWLATPIEDNDCNRMKILEGR